MEKKESKTLAMATGGGSGISLANAGMLVEAGYTTIIVGRDNRKLTTAKNILADLCIPISSDLNELSSIPPQVKKYSDEYGHIDVLVNNAGIKMAGKANPRFRCVAPLNRNALPSLFYKTCLKKFFIITYKMLLLGCIYFLLSTTLFAQSLIAARNFAGTFPIVSGSTSATICVDANDYEVVKKAADLFSKDIEMVTGKKAAVTNNKPVASNIIIIGSLGKSTFINQLVEQRKLNVNILKNKWEAYQIQVINKPFPGVDKALVIVGSDRRGTAYGVFDLSEQMGVSPWYWWADVPVKKKGEIFYSGAAKYDAPAVKYRGIFINDEAPALSGWSREKFGGFNHKFYEKVFELILRLKGNYLWPAMWGSAFNDDDTLNPAVADQYAIVMGTSHHEPLVRAHDEWRRYGKGKWNYDSNATNLKAFWTKGIQRMGTKENIVSIGMRGDGDEPMTQGTATALLERIVKDQRQIITEVTGEPANQTPQLWALYKEVQDYYDKGMRVPDDVTLLLCDDNWGNIRKLPKQLAKPHPGGYGIYYHFDYVGGPRNYKWLNTNQIERTWEQMHLAYEHGVDKIWIVNVGDIKPMEFPISFFLNYAWKPQKWTADNLPTYYTEWSTKQFGSKNAKAIGDLLAKYTRYNSRRKPELLSPETYSLTNYNEADRIVGEYNSLLAKAEIINNDLPAEYKDAFYQLVLHPIQASANLNELYVTVAKNREYAKQSLPGTNELADKAKELYQKDSMITNYYNTRLAGGKWNHMMDQTHIGYTYWQQPEKNVMPEVHYIDVAVDVLAESSSEKKSKSNSSATKETGNVFYEKEGVVSLEAQNYTRAVARTPVNWKVISNLGRTSSGVTPFPVTSPSQKAGGNSPRLEYTIQLKKPGRVKIHTYLSPTLNYYNDGLRYAISIDDEAPQIVNMHEGFNEGTWNKWVADNIIIKVTEHKIMKPGNHTLKFWMVDPGVVLQKIVVDAGGLKPSYLGPEETRRK